MLKSLKTARLLFLLCTVSTGTIYAGSVKENTEISTVFQAETCNGIVKDEAGETIIGASIVVKGTTNGTVTGVDGDFSLTNVKVGDIIRISFVGYIP
jgi:hypothetical protein